MAKISSQDGKRVQNNTRVNAYHEGNYIEQIKHLCIFYTIPGVPSTNMD